MSKKNKKKLTHKNNQQAIHTETKQPSPLARKDKSSILLSILYAVIVFGICVILALLCVFFITKSDDKTPPKDNPVFLPVTEEINTILTPETVVTLPEVTEIIVPPQSMPESTEIPPPADQDKIVLLDVKNILQRPGLPNGCEVTSLAIALNYYGYDIDPFTLYYDFMPTSDYQDGDPWTTYVGAATDLGLGCYAPCVVKTGNDYINSVYGDHQVRDVSYKKLSDYEKFIDEGTPVILWGMLDMEWNPALAWADYVNGKNVTWYSNSHCMVLIGYTEDDYIFCDPLQGIMYYNKHKVLDCFTALFKQACIIQKYDAAFDESYTEEVFDETVEYETEEEPDLWYDDDWLYDEVPETEEEYFETIDYPAEGTHDDTYEESPEDML